MQESPYRLKLSDQIDTASVYINKTVLTHGGKDHIRYRFYRFFGGGRYLDELVSNKEDLNLATYNKVNGSLLIGYYEIEHGDTLRMQFFGVKYKEGGFYGNSKGYIRNDSIFICYDDYKAEVLPNGKQETCDIYVRQKVKGLTGTPDW